MANKNNRAARLPQQLRDASPGDAPAGPPVTIYVTEEDANLEARGGPTLASDCKEGLRTGNTIKCAIVSNSTTSASSVKTSRPRRHVGHWHCLLARLIDRCRAAGARLMRRLYVFEAARWRSGQDNPSSADEPRGDGESGSPCSSGGPKVCAAAAAFSFDCECGDELRQRKYAPACAAHDPRRFL